MYLPLAGYKKKTIGIEMSVDSISTGFASRAVQPPSVAIKPQQEMQEVLSSNQNATTATGNDHASEDSGYAISCSNSMSTQDFLALRAEAEDEPFALLDEVIAKMKENVEEVGDALETIFEMAEQTSESKIALQLLEKTFEAIDETREAK